MPGVVVMPGKEESLDSGGREHAGQDPRVGPEAEFPGVLSAESRTRHVPAISSDRTHGAPPGREAPLRLGVESLYPGSELQELSTARVTDLRLSPSRG